jgi:SAM-dependent methyltransferase
MSKRELLIGCGTNRKRKVSITGFEPFENLTTLDIDRSHNPDVVHDLNVVPWPFEDNSFDEVHAYEVLEHIGRQGDYVAFFAHFTEIWRILKPDGLLCASVPAWDSDWAWGDPGHTRVITLGSLVFLDQSQYGQVGTTAMTDYRGIYKANFAPVAKTEGAHNLSFVLKAIK